jgi:hypothetical protein
MQIDHAQIDDAVILLSAGKQSQIRIRNSTTRRLRDAIPIDTGSAITDRSAHHQENPPTAK